MDYFYSILGTMNDNLNKLVDDVLPGKSIAIIGSDEYAFAVRTLLVHKGFRVDCYVENSDEDRERVINRTRAACSRYFNPTEDYIRIYSVKEALEQKKDYVYLYASLDCEDEIEEIDNIDITFCLFDWKQLDRDVMLNTVGQLSLDDIKQVEKELMRWFDNFCTENNLRYWVSGGTMLGALRHKGFIPWDDDIDIFMPDTDYEKLQELTGNIDEYGIYIIDDDDDVWGHYRFMRISDNNTIMVENYPFYKHIIGVNLEILPIVGMPSEWEERKTYIRQYDKFNTKRRQLYFECDGDMDAFRKAAKEFKPVIGNYKFDTAEYVGVLGTGYYERDTVSAKVFDTTLRVPFEDIEVNIPGGYREYLDNLYGKGWEQLPPESERGAKHNIEAYWLKNNKER